MSVAELLDTARFLVDQEGNRKAVVLEYPAWEELLLLLEDLEDSAEMESLRAQEEDTVSWEEAKAELRAAGIDV